MEYHAITITWEVVNPFPQELEDELMQLQNMDDPATAWYPAPTLTQPINFLDFPKISLWKKVYSLTFVCRAFVEARADLDAEVKETQLEDPFILPSMSGCL